MHPAMYNLSQLPVGERIELVQQLWDSIGTTGDELPIQEWHRELAKKRLTELQGREQEIALTREQMWAAVDQKRGS